MKQITYSKVFDRVVANERTINGPVKNATVDITVKLFLVSSIIGLIYVIKLLIGK